MGVALVAASILWGCEIESYPDRYRQACESRGGILLRPGQTTCFRKDAIIEMDWAKIRQGEK